MPTDRFSTEPRTLADYFAVVRRRKWIVILPLLIVPVVAYLYSMQQPERFAATSEVWVSRQNVATSLTGITNPDADTEPTRFTETQADLARVPQVVARALKRSGIQGVTAQTLFEDSSVTPHSNSDILTFTVEDSVPLRAARLVTAYAHAFSDYRLELATASLANARADLESDLRRLARRGMTATQLYRQLNERSQELRTLELLQTKPAVVRQASGAEQIAPTPERYALLGIALGLLLGVAAAFLWDALDRRVRDETEVEAALGIPLLARISSIGRGAEGQAILAMEEEPTELEAESIRRLRTSLEFANLDLNAKVVMITSAVPEEGKSLAAANLALALAHSGRRVALVDLDLRRPSIGGLFGIPPGRGVTEVALDRVELDAALVRIPLRVKHAEVWARPAARSNDEVERGVLLVLSAGQGPSSPSEFLGTRIIREIVDALRARADYVLVDTPPLLPVSDARIISSYVDATLVVTRLGKLTRPDLRELARELDSSRAPKLGFILTGSEPPHYYGTYGSDEETPSQRRKVEPILPAPVTDTVTPIRAANRPQEGGTRRWV